MKTAAAAVDVEVLPWLKLLPVAPEFRPSEAEFADPIAYILRIEKEASQYGICKIIPPIRKLPKKDVFANLNRSLSAQNQSGGNNGNNNSNSSRSSSNDGSVAVAAGVGRFSTRQQQLGWSPKRPRGATPGAPACSLPSFQPVVQKSVWQSGETYTVEEFESKAKLFSKSRMKCTRNVAPTVVETLFWQAAADKPITVEYGNDIPATAFREPRNSKSSISVGVDSGSVSGSGRKRKKGNGGPRDPFSDISETAWNMRTVSRAQGSLLRFMPEEISGVTSPMVYIGMLFSWFAWHVEDHDLHSLNYMHTGAAKTWYCVPGEAAAAFEEVVRREGYGGQVNPLVALSMLGEKTTVMSPEVLMAAGIPCCRLVQNAGEFVITFPRAYHLGFSHGFNCGEATNLATPGWLKMAKEAAIRRAAIKHLPMFSHQQLLYLLALAYSLRLPFSESSAPHSARLKDKQKGEGEAIVKSTFVRDIAENNNLLSILLHKSSVSSAVLWNSTNVTCHFPSSPLAFLSFKGQHCSEIPDLNDPIIASPKSNFQSIETSTTFSGVLARDTNYISTGKNAENKGYQSNEAKHEQKSIDSIDAQSGILKCVACGLLGFASMVVIQPSQEAAKMLLLNYNEHEKQNSCQKPKLANQYCDFSNTNGTSDCGKVPLEKRNSNDENRPHNRDGYTITYRRKNETSTSSKSVSTTSKMTKLKTDTKGAAQENKANTCEADSKHVSSFNNCGQIQIKETNNMNANLHVSQVVNSPQEPSSLLYCKAPVGTHIGTGETNSTNTEISALDLLAATYGDIVDSDNEIADDEVNNEFSGDAKQHQLEDRGTNAVHVSNSDHLSSTIDKKVGRNTFISEGRLERVSLMLKACLQGSTSPCMRNNGKDSTKKPMIAADTEPQNDDNAVGCGITAFTLESIDRDHKSPLDEKQMDEPSINKTTVQTYSSKDAQPLNNSTCTVPGATSTLKSLTPNKGFFRARLFCIEHALEVLEPLLKMGGADVLILSHVDYPVIEKQARCLATEFYPGYEWKAISYRGAVFEDLRFINSAIDNEDDLDVYSDWTAQPQMGMCLRHSVKLSKSPLYSKQLPDNSVLDALFLRNYRNVCAGDNECESPWYCTQKRKSRKNNQRKLLVAGRWCGRVWMGNQVHPFLSPSEESKNSHMPEFGHGKESHVLFNAIESNSKFPPNDMDILDKQVQSAVRGLVNVQKQHPFGKEKQELEIREIDYEQPEEPRDNDLISEAYMKEKPSILRLKKSGLKRKGQSDKEYNSNSKKSHEVRGSILANSHWTDQHSVQSLLPRKDKDLNISCKHENKLKSNYLTDNRSPKRNMIKDQLSFQQHNCSDSSSLMYSDDNDSLVNFVKDAGGKNRTSNSGKAKLNDLSSQEETMRDGLLLNLLANTCLPSHSCKENNHLCSYSKRPKQGDLQENDNDDSDGLKECDCQTPSMGSPCGISDNQGANPRGVKRQKTGALRTRGSIVGENAATTNILKNSSLRKLQGRQSHHTAESVEGGPCTRLRSKTKPDDDKTEAGEGTLPQQESSKHLSRGRKKSVKGKKVVDKDMYCCDMEGCSMSFASKQELQLHKRNLCTFKGCGKHFFSHKYLMQHRRVHFDDRPLSCPWKGCKMTFKWAWARTEHYRVHTGERPYSCKTSGCGKTFRFVSDYSRHKRKTGHS